jgi:hypothetical protein
MPPSDDRDEERRKTQRHKAFKGANVIFNNRNSVVTGVVKDLSEAGAKFVVSAPVELPAAVHLRFPNGDERKAEIIWQHGKTQFGLRFVDPKDN